MNTTDDLNGTHTSALRSGGLAVLSTAAAATLVMGSGIGATAAFGATPTGTNSSQITAAGAQIQPSGGGVRSGFGRASSASGSTPAVPATAAQQVGVVDVTSQLGYAGAESMGTGMVLTPNGEILTNNHVVEGATSIGVTVVSTGASYTASVVGTDATDDIAVLQLAGASGLHTAAIDSSAAVAVGSVVTGVGNAGGVGGVPSAAPGTVTAVDQSITTQAEGAAASENLSGLIETSANIQAGDSGGPLYNASDQIIGIDTAAASGGYAVAGYAIPITTALSIAGQIESGQASAEITIGNPAFLGVEVIPTTESAASGYGRSLGGVPTQTVPGATIGGVFVGTAAANAGLAAGDTITDINGTAIGSASDLSSALAGYAPGQSVTLTWTTDAGASATATVTLGAGPAA